MTSSRNQIPARLVNCPSFICLRDSRCTFLVWARRALCYVRRRTQNAPSVVGRYQTKQLRSKPMQKLNAMRITHENTHDTQPCPSKQNASKQLDRSTIQYIRFG